MIPNRNKKNFPLYLVSIIFIFPVIVGTVLYYFHDSFNFKTTNHGVLVRPPILASYLYPKEEQKKWRIIHVSGKLCDNDCQKIDYQLQKVQKALGKNQKRVAVIALPATFPAVKDLQTAFDKQATHYEVTHKIYLIDPLGNLFMYYPDTTDPMNVLKDLKKVLEVSQIG